MSLVALALQITNSDKAEEAFSILSRNARQEVKYVYWGEDFVPLPSYRVELQRPHLLPRKPHRHDAGNVAATACALRVYAARGELLTPAIVRWLQYQRAHDDGWMSTLVSRRCGNRQEKELTLRLLLGYTHGVGSSARIFQF